MGTRVARVWGVSGFVLVWLWGCTTTCPEPPATPNAAASEQAPPAASPPEAEASKRYLSALQDSAIPTESEIDDHLVAITRSSTYPLEWESAAPNARVKVATLMSEATFQRFYEQDPPGRTAPNAWAVIWVTATPQLRTFCQALPGDSSAKERRLKEWLGLNPTKNYHRVVELWIDVDSLARPCPDNEVTDTACTLTDTTSTSCALNDAGQPVPDPSYATWFNDNYHYSYKADGQPWTRLGYTYDWAANAERSDPRSHVGASEFIVKPNAAYEIVSRKTVAEYCTPP